MLMPAGWVEKAVAAFTNINQRALCLKAKIIVDAGQYHLAVAGGCAAFLALCRYAPTRYREVVLTRNQVPPLTVEA